MLGDRVMIDACVGGGDDGCLWRRWGACAGGGVTMDACVGGEGVMDACVEGQGDD